MAILSTQATRTCDYCGEVVRGRSDKRFCNSECRNGYHNHMSGINDALMRKINKVLRRNRRILIELTPDGKNYASRTRLEDLGFNFNYHTHLVPSREGQHYSFCYEFGYLEIKENYFMLVHRSEDRRSTRATRTDEKDPT